MMTPYRSPILEDRHLTQGLWSALGLDVIAGLIIWYCHLFNKDLHLVVLSAPIAFGFMITILIFTRAFLRKQEKKLAKEYEP